MAGFADFCVSHSNQDIQETSQSSMALQDKEGDSAPCNEAEYARPDNLKEAWKVAISKFLDVMRGPGLPTLPCVGCIKLA